MSRNKAWPALLLLALCLWSSAFGESLISEEKIMAETLHHTKTYTAEKTTFSRSYSEQASEFFPFSTLLRFEGENARFGEFLVRAKEEVKAGDVLATFAPEEDAVALAGKRQALLRAQEALARETASQQAAIEKQHKALADASDPFDQELLTLRIRRAQVALEQYQNSQQRLIASLEQEIQALEADGRYTALIAPFDGVVTTIHHKRAGQALQKGDALITLQRTDGMLLRIPNQSGHFRYGMKVEVLAGPANNRTRLTGQIVASDEMFPQQVRTGYAYIRLDPASGVYQSLKVPPSVSAPGCYAEGVIVLPSRAVTIDSGKYYVHKLRGGVKEKRCVTLAVQDVLNIWVLQGVEEGDIIIMD